MRKMPRKSKVKKPGVRRYGTLSNYSSEKLEEVLEKIKSGALTQREAAKTYKIPRSTLRNKLNKKHVKPIGRPTCLTMEVEITFRDHLLALSDAGIPVGLNDLKILVKRYLDSINKVQPVFTDNTPGYEWAKLYLERHPALKEKIAHNISRKRAQVNREMLNEFFDHFTSEADGVCPENIYNMDESGFHDDPGKQKLLFRRANRHPDIIRNATKSCFTVVFCGNAIGELIPPFFIFKGKHCWSDWLHNAPKLSKMAVSKSGWIDTDIFEEWLEKHFIPIVDKKEGKKILLCDNLSSHISVKALKLCEEHHIKFICLVPNSTHLLQPLDVGYFASLKTAWRSVLRKWRQTQRGWKAISLPKNLFAQLVKLALEQSQSTAGLNLMTGFRKCGLYPLSRTEVLQTLPEYATTDVQAAVSETFKEYLNSIRESDLNIKTTRKFQLPVVAGKAISAEEVEMFQKNKEDGQKKKKQSVKRGRPKGSKNVTAKRRKTAEKENDKPTEENDLTIPEYVNSDKESGVELTHDSPKTKETVLDSTEKHKSYIDKDYQSDAEDPIISTEAVSVHSPKKKKSQNKTLPQRKKNAKTFEGTKNKEIVSSFSLLRNEVDAACIENPELEKGKMLNDETEPILDITIEPEKALEDLVGYEEDITGEFLVADHGELVQIHEQEEVFEVNKFCVFKDEGTLFPGRIINISGSPPIIHVSCLTKNFGGGWMWPDKADVTVISDLTMIIKVLRDNKISKKGKIIYIDDPFLYMEWGE